MECGRREPALRCRVMGAGIALLLGTAPIALAQTATTGTVNGTLDGEVRTWHVLEHRSDEGVDGSATILAMPGFRGDSYILDVQAHPEERFSVEGALHLSGMFDSLEGCPCELTLTDSMFWTTSSMFDAVYQALEATVVVDSVAQVEDGVYRVTGSFSALLGFMESAMEEGPDATRTVMIEGTFDLERVLLRE